MDSCPPQACAPALGQATTPPPPPPPPPPAPCTCPGAGDHHPLCHCLRALELGASDLGGACPSGARLL